MNQRFEKYRRVLDQTFPKIMMVILAVVLGLNLLWPDKEFSEMENRNLQGFPVSGADFGQRVDSWFADQFVGRNFLLHVNYVLKKLGGVREISDVYLGKGQLLQDPSVPDQDLLDSEMDAINAFAQKYEIPSYVMVVPTAAQVQGDKLPMFADPQSESEVLASLQARAGENVTAVAAGDELNAHGEEYIYYKTDHHWTSLGAYYAFCQLRMAQGQEVPGLDSYKRLQISKNFKGTLASMVGSLFLDDDIYLYTRKDEPDYLVTYGSSGKKSGSIYDLSALDRKNQYEVFLGGNEGQITIEVNNDSDKHLLLFKDSYANSMIQFLLPYYRTITIIDPRYFYDDIDRVIKNDLINEIVYVYNYDTFNSKNGLREVLAVEPQEEAAAEEVPAEAAVE